MTQLSSKTRAERLVASVHSVYHEQKSWRGRCYEVAGSLIMLLQREGVTHGVRLVHGKPVGRGKHNAGERYGHAWVEVGDQVYDLTVTNKPMSRALYYIIGQINGAADATYYTATRALTLMVRHGHYGSWPKASKKKEVTLG